MKLLRFLRKILVPQNIPFLILCGIIAYLFSWVGVVILVSLMVGCGFLQYKADPKFRTALRKEWHSTD